MFFFIFEKSISTNHPTEEEKKLVAGLLSKLYISSGSSEDKLRETYEEVCIAVEESVVTDAPSKNALYKVHVSLGKIVNALDEQQPQRSSRSVSALPEHQLANEGKAVSEEPVIKEEDEDSDGTVIATHNRSTPSHGAASDEEMED